MLGHLMEWFYSGLGGIYQEDSSLAYEKIIIAPKPVGDIKWVNCSFNSPKGNIVSNWNIEGNTFTLNVKIPKGSVAKIIIPKSYSKSIISVIDLIKTEAIEVNSKDRVLNLTSGKYKIITN